MRREHALRNRGNVVNPKKNKDYVWVNINDHRQIEYQTLGYELCRDPEIKTAWKKEDGSHQRGDLVLYQIDKEEREAMHLDNELRGFEAISAPKQVFHTMVQREGAKVYEPAPR